MKYSSRLLLDEQPLQILPSLAVKLGLNKAMFLQQLHYWLQKDSAHERDGQRWIYNTYEEWHEQFPFWSVQVLRKRIVKPLEEAGLITTTGEYNAMPQDKTKWYTINYEALNRFLGEPADDTTSPTLNPPDKITTPTGQNNHTRTGQNNHTVNQRLPETNNRDSVLQTGEASSPPPKNEKAEPPGRYFNRVTADLIKEYEERGRKFFKQTPDEKKKSGDQFVAEFKAREMRDLDLAIRYRVERAAGLVQDEFASWCSLRYALSQVDEGWRPKSHLRAVSEPEELSEEERAFFAALAADRKGA